MSSQTKIRSALKQLHKYGADALRPHKVVDPTQKRQKWKRPIVSKRVAATLRKQAIRDGVFGSYDPNTGIGWDPQWDIDSTTTESNQLPWMQIRPHKETKRERTREDRAVKIETLLEGADDKILQYRIAQREKKPERGIEVLLKKMTSANKK